MFPPPLRDKVHKLRVTPVAVASPDPVYNRLNNEARDTQGDTTMPQIIDRNAAQTAATQTTAPTTGLTQWISRKWDLVGVLALMTSSAAYGVFALSHLAAV